MVERLCNIRRTPSDRTPELLNSRPPAVGGNNPVDATQTTTTIFQINNAKRQVPVVTLSINDHFKFLENIKQGFNRTVYCNKYRSKITTQPKHSNLDYMIDPTLRNINRLFFLSFKNGDNDPTRNCFDKYCMSLVEIEDFSALIGNKPFFDIPINNKQETYEKLIEMSRNK